MPTTDSGTSRDAFFHNSVNISEWMKEKITEAIRARGHRVVLMHVEAEVMTRMSKVTVINGLTVQFKDKEEHLYALSDYSSINKDYDGSKNTRWLVDAIKELEMEAILKFGGKALKTQVDEEYRPKSINVGSAEPKNTENIRLTYYFSARLEEMVRFLTEPEFIARWTFGSARFDKDTVSVGDLVLRDVRSAQLSRGSAVTMDYKWKDWPCFSRVEMRLAQIGDNVQVSLSQKDVPSCSVDIVKRHWFERVFLTISQLFNCPIKSI